MVSQVSACYRTVRERFAASDGQGHHSDSRAAVTRLATAPLGPGLGSCPVSTGFQHPLHQFFDSASPSEPSRVVTGRLATCDGTAQTQHLCGLQPDGRRLGSYPQPPHRRWKKVETDRGWRRPEAKTADAASPAPSSGGRIEAPLGSSHMGKQGPRGESALRESRAHPPAPGRGGDLRPTRTSRRGRARRTVADQAFCAFVN